MLIRMKNDVNGQEIQKVVRWLIRTGLDVLINNKRSPVLVVILGNHFGIINPQDVEDLPGVEEVLLTDTPLGLAVDETSLTLEESLDDFEEGWLFLALAD